VSAQPKAVGPNPVAGTPEVPRGAATKKKGGR